MSTALHPWSSRWDVTLGRPWRALRAAGRTAVFAAKMVPGPRSPADLVTRAPAIEHVIVATRAGPVDAVLYRPASSGPHPGVVATFGIVPPGVTDPRIAQVGEALARSGFVTLVYCSPTSQDLRLEPADVDELVRAYSRLLEQTGVDASRCGFWGVCIGSAYALMAAADRRIRDRVRFVCAYAPYASMWTLAVDIASGSRDVGVDRAAWVPDPLTWKVYVRSVTGWLAAPDADRLRSAFEGRIAWDAARTHVVRSPAGELDAALLSADGRAALRLLRAGADDVESALRALPPAAQALLTSMSPLSYVRDIGAHRVILLHDRDDHVVPVSESRRLWSALRGRPGVTYTEMGLRHMRMPEGMGRLRIARELLRTYAAWYALFRETTR